MDVAAAVCVRASGKCEGSLDGRGSARMWRPACLDPLKAGGEEPVSPECPLPHITHGPGLSPELPWLHCSPAALLAAAPGGLRCVWRRDACSSPGTLVMCRWLIPPSMAPTLWHKRFCTWLRLNINT